MLSEYYKGQKCKYRDFLCQEGYCSNCEIHHELTRLSDLYTEFPKAVKELIRDFNRRLN